MSQNTHVHIPNHWKKVNNTLVRVFIFNSFVQCVDFITKITPIAEKMNHHPNIEIFQYKHVKICITTFENKNSITTKDTELAEKINTICI
jgi:4a-hydroxytetrahydrobiopterin dehydratase